MDGVRKGFGQFVNNDFDAFYIGEVDNLPNGFGVVHNDEYFYVGFFEDGNFKGEGLWYNYKTKEAHYGTFEKNEMVDGEMLTLTSDYADKELSLCHIVDEEYDYSGICRNGVPGGLGFWIFFEDGKSYPYWGQFEMIEGVLYNHGWGIEIAEEEDEVYSYIGYWGKNDPEGKGLIIDYL